MGGLRDEWVGGWVGGQEGAVGSTQPKKEQRPGIAMAKNRPSNTLGQHSTLTKKTGTIHIWWVGKRGRLAVLNRRRNKGKASQWRRTGLQTRAANVPR